MGVGLPIDLSRGGFLLLASLVVLLSGSGLGGCRCLFLLTLGFGSISLCLLFWWCNGCWFLNCNFDFLSPFLDQIGVLQLRDLVDVVLDLELEFDFATALHS